MRTFTSIVKGHEGKCAAVWLNPNQSQARLDGGTTGFFRSIVSVGPVRLRSGKEFHGIVKDGVVQTTALPE